MPTVEQLDAARFRGLTNDWNGLLSRSGQDTPFLRWEWLMSWLDSFEEADRFVFLAVYEAESLIGLAPFVIRGDKRPGGGRTLQFAAARELYPDYLDIIAAPGHEKAVMDAIFEYLDKNVEDWDVVVLDCVRGDSNVLLHGPSERQGWVRTVEPASACPVVDLHGSMEEYMARQFKRKSRYNLRRQARIALEDEGLRLEKIDREDVLESSVREFLVLHAKRAAQKGTRSSITNRAVEAFLETVSLLFFRAGILELWFLRKGETAVSAIYGFRAGGRFYFYQSGSDPAWSRFSVGTVLLMLVLERSFSDGLAVFDFLKGDEEYKRTWSTGEVEQYRIRFYRRSWRGRARRQRDRMIGLLRQARNALVGATGRSL